jgi:hypothetical protein
MPFSNEPQRLFVIFMTAACDPPTRLISVLYEDEILQILLINQNTIVSLVPFYRNNCNESLAINNSRSESNYLTFFLQVCSTHVIARSTCSNICINIHAQFLVTLTK